MVRSPAYVTPGVARELADAGFEAGPLVVVTTGDVGEHRTQLGHDGPDLVVCRRPVEALVHLRPLLWEPSQPLVLSAGREDFCSVRRMETVIAVAEAVRAGDRPAVEVLDDCLLRLEAANPDLNAFVVIDEGLA